MNAGVARLRRTLVLALIAVLTLSFMSAADDTFFPGWRSRTWPHTPDVRLDGWHVVIDPGHGGTEPGAGGQNNTFPEKHFNLVIGKKVESLLRGSAAQVTMTRTADVTVALADRVNLANSVGGHRFLSIHINACCGATGIETWVDAHGVDAAKHPSTAHVWRDYADTIHSHLIQGARTIEPGVRDRGVKLSGITGPWSNDRRIYVLRSDRINMPAALVEVNFIDTPSDYALLIRDDYQDAVAAGIVQGFYRHAVEYNPEDGLLQ